MKIAKTLKDLPKIDYRELTPIQGALKTLSGENEEKLLKSLTKFGFIVPLFIWKSDKTYLIDGHQRHTVLMHNEIKPYKLPFVEIEAKTEQEAKEKLLVISSQYGTINQEGYEGFTIEFKDTKIEDIIEFDLLEFEEEERPEAQEDDFEVPGEIKTDIVLGDLFEIGEHRLLCGDSTCSDTVAKLMNGKKADMVFADPPYDMSDLYSCYLFKYAKIDSSIFIMNSDKNIIENVNNNIDSFRRFFAVDFRQARLISNNMPMTRVDIIAEFNRGKTRFNNTKDGFSTLLQVAKIHSEKGETIHKQEKKVELPSSFILHYSLENEIILDLFLGSGTTMVASHQLNRICYGMELDTKYCDVIVQRMLSLDNTLTIKRNGKDETIKWLNKLKDGN